MECLIRNETAKKVQKRRAGRSDKDLTKMNRSLTRQSACGWQAQKTK